MKFDLYQVDAFTNKTFGGNPACIVPLTNWLSDELMKKIAAENAVAETAFFIPARDHYLLKWFTPEFEMDLCGHATLATAHILKTVMNHQGNEIVFHTNAGILSVTAEDGLYTMDLPSRKPVAAELPKNLRDSLSIQPLQVLKSRDYILVYEKEQQVREIKINKDLFNRINLDPGGVCITARGESCDFVSRFFTPQASIFEDFVTGSAHCSLIPYWSEQLQKTTMKALQVSERLGELHCVDKGDRVLIAGNAKTYSAGSIWIDE